MDLPAGSETLRRAGEIWDYMSSFASRSRSDAIVLCCSYDLRVCDHACKLVDAGIADTLVISGRHGNWPPLKSRWSDHDAPSEFAASDRG